YAAVRPRRPSSPLFPYTTLFRSLIAKPLQECHVAVAPRELAPAHLDICATHNSLGHGWFAPPVPLCGRFLPRLRPRRQAMRSFFFWHGPLFGRHGQVIEKMYGQRLQVGAEPGDILPHRVEARRI